MQIQIIKIDEVMLINAQQYWLLIFSSKMKHNIFMFDLYRITFIPS